jgi:biopolymer transport protein TolR
MSANVESSEVKPAINVTPLIDVLLVMLIIFMVAVPLRPSRFLAQIPEKPDERPMEPSDLTLVVTIAPDRTLKLNGLGEDMGTVDDTSKLSVRLVDLFKQRKENHVYRAGLRTRIDVPEDLRIEKTVFIKAPRVLNYSDIVKVIDGLKGAGANPVGLQLDGLQ